MITAEKARDLVKKSHIFEWEKETDRLIREASMAGSFFIQRSFPNEINLCFLKEKLKYLGYTAIESSKPGEIYISWGYD